MARQWVDKPPRQRLRKYDWEAIAAELRKRPGEWTMIDDEANLGVQANVHAKKMKALRSDEWDYKASVSETNQETRTCKLWMSAVRKDEHG